MKIDICFASNDNYSPYMGTAIASILYNSKEDENITFHIISENINEDNKNKLISLKKIKDFNIIFYEPKKEIYRYITKYNMKAYSTFFRLSIPSLMPNIDKILYLDCDMIVNKSLRELFEIDMQNNYAFVVEDIMDKLNEVKAGIEFDKNDRYFNAGFLMINNKLWIENNLEQEFYDFLDKTFLAFKDQDVLNYCLKNRVKFLDKKWNFLDYKFCYRGNKPDINEINIIHSIGKPWKKECNISFFQDEFWKYYQLTPWFFERPIDAIQTILYQKYGDYENQKLKNNDIKFLGIYHNRNTLQIVIFFIRITIEMDFKNVSKIAWWIPVRKWRESFKRTFDI